jgi:uncharacterized protein (AIM24 family)
MNALLGRLTAPVEKLVSLFACTDPQDERRCFGLGQFVVLLTLTPFVLTATLFNFSPSDKVISLYQYDAARFPALEPLPASIPKPAELSEETTAKLTNCRKLHQAITDGVMPGLGQSIYLQECVPLSLGLIAAARQYAQREAERDNVRERVLARTQPLDDKIFVERKIDSVLDHESKGPSFFSLLLDDVRWWLSRPDLSQEVRQAAETCKTYRAQAQPPAHYLANCMAIDAVVMGHDQERKVYELRSRVRDIMRKAEQARARDQNLMPKTALFQGNFRPNGYAEAVLGEKGEEFSDNHAWFFLLTLLLYVPTVWLCIKRRHIGMLVFGLIVWHAYVVAVVLHLVNVPFAHLPWLYVLLPKIAFLWFAAKAKIRSKSFGFYVLLATCFALAQGLSGSSGLTLSLSTVVMFVLALVVVRLLFQGCWENAYLLRNLGWRRSLRVGAHTLVLWLPMALLAIPYFFLTEHFIPKAVVNELYDNRTLKHPYGHDLRDNVLQSTADHFDERIFRWHVATETVKREVMDHAEQLRNNGLEKRLMAEFDHIMPPALAFDAVETGVPVIGSALDSGAEKIQGSVNDAYKAMRSDIERDLRAFVKQKDQEFQASLLNPTEVHALNTLADVKRRGVYLMLQANRQTQDAVWWTFAYLRAAHLLTLLLFALVCVKSFLYVFARISFHRDAGTFLTVGQSQVSGHDASQAKIAATGQQYTFPRGIEETFYVSRRFQCRGKAPKFSVPQPLHAPIARLMHGAMTMNKLELNSSEGVVSCTATRGAEFLEWELRDGEVVLFNFHHFVGMSESVQISTVISPRISTLLLGRFIFSAATGPGKLILVTEGRAEIAQGKEAAQSLPPERLVAMHVDTRLHVDSELGFADIYLSTAYIRPAGGGRVIVDVDCQQGATVGLIRFFKNFLWPA